MEAFDESIRVHIRYGTRKVIVKYCHKYPELFENPSHFIRCAIELKLRELRKEGKYYVDEV